MLLTASSPWYRNPVRDRPDTSTLASVPRGSSFSNVLGEWVCCAAPLVVQQTMAEETRDVCVGRTKGRGEQWPSDMVFLEDAPRGSCTCRSFCQIRTNADATRSRSHRPSKKASLSPPIPLSGSWKVAWQTNGRQQTIPRDNFLKLEVSFTRAQAHLSTPQELSSAVEPSADSSDRGVLSVPNRI